VDSRPASTRELTLPPSAAGGRYRIERLLARGEHTRTYQVSDAADGGRRIALERLSKAADPSERARFEREFHLRKRIRHPNLLEVYELGYDDAGSYFTTELVDGPELQRAAPLPWREVCAVGRALCGALSALHAERLVHRQLGPRSVRRSASGANLYKLLDCRALVPFGPSKQLVGMASCSAPESVQLRALDARADLFALGATLYFALVGQHAYPAREYAELNDAWQHGFAHASELVPDVPAALDALLCDLLRLDPNARPASAREVVTRLAAIDGAGMQGAHVEAGYLPTPALVGRDDVLIKLRGCFTRANTGGTVLIEGAPGVGRSRVLDACLLEATMLGITVLSVDASDAASGDYGVLRALSERLFEALPQLAREAAGPQLELLTSLMAADPPGAESALESALCDWIRAVSRARPLMIGVDDFSRIDPPSARALARVMGEVTPGLWLACVVEAGRSGPALQHARRIRVDVLGPADVEALLRSWFGAVPQLALMAQRAHALSAGRPRELMRMAQCWVDRSVMRWTGSSWRFAGFSP
jgi:hypothetical protein